MLIRVTIWASTSALVRNCHLLFLQFDNNWLIVVLSYHILSKIWVNIGAGTELFLVRPCRHTFSWTPVDQNINEYWIKIQVIFLKKMYLKNVVCKVAASLFRSQSVNLVIITLADYLGRTHQKRVNMFCDPLINYVIQYPLCFEGPPGFPSGEYSLYDFMMPVIKLQTLENNEIAVNVADDIAKKLRGALFDSKLRSSCRTGMISRASS